MSKILSGYTGRYVFATYSSPKLFNTKAKDVTFEQPRKQDFFRHWKDQLIMYELLMLTVPFRNLNTRCLLVIKIKYEIRNHLGGYKVRQKNK